MTLSRFRLHPCFLASGVVLLHSLMATAQQPGASDTSFAPPAELNVGTVVLREDGRLLVASSGLYAGAPRRLHADGSPDVSFQSDPLVTVESMWVLADDRVVLLGNNSLTMLSSSGLRLFPGSGFDGQKGIVDLAPTPDGGAYAFGIFRRGGNGSPTNITRFLALGPTDPLFNWHASLEYPQSDQGLLTWPLGHLRLLGDGRFVVAGSFIRANGRTRGGFARFDGLGTLDEGFDPGTSLGLPVVSNRPAARIRFLNVQNDGRLLTALSMELPEGGTLHRFVRLLEDGRVDESFAPPVELVETADALVLLSDGGVVVSGAFSTVAGQNTPGLIRLTSAGVPDPAFQPQLPGANPRVEAIQPDGRILVTVDDDSVPGTLRRRLIRLFGYSGPALTPRILVAPHSLKAAMGESNAFLATVAGWPPPALQWQYNNENLPDETNRVLRLPHLTDSQAGTYRLVVRNDAGMAHAEAGLTLGIRSVPAGSLLPGFAARFSPPGFPHALLPLGDGSVLVGGNVLPLPAAGGGTTTMLLRLRPDGALDPAFPSPLPGGIVNRLLSDDSGRVYVAGRFSRWNDDTHGGLVRLRPDGSVDESFKVTLSPPEVRSIALQPDGSLLLGGAFRTVNGVGRLGLARVRENGELDVGFQALLRGTSQVYQLSLEADGSVLVGGIELFPPGGNTGALIGLIRLDSAGQVVTTYSGANDSVAAFLPGSRPVLMNFVGSLRRLQPDGSLDPEFRFSTLNTFPALPPLLAADDQQFYAFGGGSIIQERLVPGMCRYLSGGTLDPTFRLGIGVTRKTVNQFYATAATTLEDGNLLLSLLDIGSSETRIVKVETRAARLRVLSAEPSGIQLELGIPDGDPLNLDSTSHLAAPDWRTLQKVTGDGFNSAITLPASSALHQFYRLRPAE